MPEPLAGFAQLLVGHQWPSLASITEVSLASRNRRALGADQDSYADLLRSIRFGQMAAQEGIAAEHLSASFSHGESRSREIASKNAAKARAYDIARQSALQLRTDLTAIAEQGESDIRHVLTSNAPASQKISRIVDLVAAAQSRANMTAARYSNNVLDAIQNVLDTDGTGTSSRQFARQNGSNLDTAFASAGADQIRDRVTAMVAEPQRSPSDSPREGTPVPLGVAPAAATPPATHSRGLRAYGSDPHPSAAAVAPAAAAAPAAPGPAPISATNGTVPLTKASAVRSSTPALAAAGARATAAAGFAHPAGSGRLRRLLEAVARQQPGLAWAVGDRADGTTVLVTDLAGGWIPPHIEIPTGVVLLEPNSRHGDLAALLGDTTESATHAPGRLVSAAPDADGIPVSVRARDTPPVEDLGWELAQATRWRDGLPRLAHTLARAAAHRTGYLDSEVALLREELQTAASRVLAAYPDSVDDADVANWQLLATIDALVDADRAPADYHFSWFQARSRQAKAP